MIMCAATSAFHGMVPPGSFLKGESITSAYKLYVKSSYVYPRWSCAAMAEELRSSAWHCLRSSSHLPPSHKLALLRHFVLAFSRLGDLESQLVLRYEILSLCEANGTTDSEMRVDITDWISFAEDCLSAGFLSNASKAYEKVIACMQGCQRTNSEQDLAVCRISKHLQHRAMTDITDKIGSQSRSSTSLVSQCERPTTAVSRYMAGIRKREKAKLQMLRARNE